MQGYWLITNTAGLYSLLANCWLIHKHNRKDTRLLAKYKHSRIRHIMIGSLLADI